MPVIEVQRDSATRTRVEPRKGQTEIECIDELVQRHGAGSVLVDGRKYSEAMKDLETTDDPAKEGAPAVPVPPPDTPPPTAAKKMAKAKGGAA